MTILNGLPQLPSGLQTIINAVNVLGVNLNSVLPNSATSAVWGIFDSEGNAVMAADTMLSFDYRNDFDIAEYPQEQGAFTSYNKVNRPFDIRIRLAKGGSETERSAFLSDVQLNAESLDLYQIITPDAVYLNANINHVDYHREQRNGATMLVVDVYFVEIRQASTTSGMTESNTQSISSPEAINAGQVQPSIPTDAQVALISSTA